MEGQRELHWFFRSLKFSKPTIGHLQSQMPFHLQINYVYTVGDGSADDDGLEQWAT